MLSIISPTRDTSREKRDLYVKITETDKRKEFTESDETSLLIYEEKHIGEINYKALLREEKVNTFFFPKQREASTIMRSPVLLTVFLD